MQSRFLRSVVAAAVLIIAVAGCGGTGASQSEPAGAVKAAMDAAQSGGIAKMADYACAAQKDNIEGLFGGGGLGSLESLGISADDLAAAMKMEFKDIQTTEKSKSGNNAVVHVKATMTITLDPAKMRELMKKVMEAQGTPVDDAMLDTIISGMSSQLTQTEPIDDDVAVVQEGGKWLLCE